MVDSVTTLQEEIKALKREQGYTASRQSIYNFIYGNLDKFPIFEEKQYSSSGIIKDFYGQKYAGSNDPNIVAILKEIKHALILMGQRENVLSLIAQDKREYYQNKGMIRMTANVASMVYRTLLTAAELSLLSGGAISLKRFSTLKNFSLSVLRNPEEFHFIHPLEYEILKIAIDQAGNHKETIPQSLYRESVKTILRHYEYTYNKTDINQNIEENESVAGDINTPKEEKDETQKFNLKRIVELMYCFDNDNTIITEKNLEKVRQNLSEFISNPASINPNLNYKIFQLLCHTMQKMPFARLQPKREEKHDRYILKEKIDIWKKTVLCETSTLRAIKELCKQVNQRLKEYFEMQGFQGKKLTLLLKHTTIKQNTLNGQILLSPFIDKDIQNTPISNLALSFICEIVEADFDQDPRYRKVSPQAIINKYRRRPIDAFLEKNPAIAANHIVNPEGYALDPDLEAGLATYRNKALSL